MSGQLDASINRAYLAYLGPFLLHNPAIDACNSTVPPVSMAVGGPKRMNAFLQMWVVRHIKPSTACNEIDVDMLTSCSDESFVGDFLNLVKNAFNIYQS